MQRETLWNHVREVWHASSVLLQKEGNKLNNQQHDSVITIFNGITRLRQALLEADRKYKISESIEDTDTTDWNHLLLSPLTSVRGYSKLLLDGAFGQLTGHQTQLVSTIHNSSQPLTDLIGDLYLEANKPINNFVPR